MTRREPARHRRPPMPPPQPAGSCRWCAEPILYPDGHKRAGEPNLRRNWHAECAQRYLLATRSVEQREACWQRDRGRCAACGTTAVRLGWMPDGPGKFTAWNTPDRPWSARVTDADRAKQARLGTGVATLVRYGTVHEWDADHVRPLWSAPPDMPLGDRDAWWGLGNLQTLCRACHAGKTAAEAAARAARKRGIA